MAGPTRAFWKQRFVSGSTPWDRGRAGPQLQRRLDSDVIAPGQRVVVPGCGSGWEVAALAAAGLDALGLDYVAAAVKRTRMLLAAHGLAAEVAHADVLQWRPPVPVDAVYEQTCLCALDPDDRSAYAAQLAAWVRPGGELLALFMQKREASAGDGVISGLPYHCDIHAIRALFPSTVWAWPEPPYAHVTHPSGAYELAIELVRQV